MTAPPLTETIQSPDLPPATIMQGDCLNLLDDLGDESVDLVLTDPPYMIGASSMGQSKSRKYDGHWEDLLNAAVFYEKWMSQCYSKLKPNGWMLSFTNWRSLPMVTKATTSAGIPIASMLVWDKGIIGTSSKRQLRPSYELVLFMPAAEAIIKNRSQADIIKSKWLVTQRKHHPAQKPVDLLKQLVALTLPDDKGLVLDPFMGSGSSLVAARELGHQSIGIEANPKFYQAAKERLEIKKQDPDQ